MLLGSIAAIGQDNIKRLMAYSSIGHIGFVLIGIASGTDKGLSAVLIYMVLYVIMNIGVFVFILNMERNGVAVTSVNSLNMYNEVSKVQTLFLTILLFSLAGIPPLAGFFAKFYVFMAVIEQSMFFLAIVGLLATDVAAFYYLRIIKVIYFDNEVEKYDTTHSFGLKLSLIITTILILMQQLHPREFQWEKNDYIDKLFGTNELRIIAAQNKSPDYVPSLWLQDVYKFYEFRKPFLLY